MRIDILTVLPSLLESPFGDSIVKRAKEKGHVEIHVHSIRNFTEDSHRTVDDYPYGGGAGMVLLAGPISKAIEQLKSERNYDEIIYESFVDIGRKLAIELKTEQVVIFYSYF